MASKKHYKINREANTVEAVLSELNEKDIKEIKICTQLGMTFIPVEPEPKEKLTKEEEKEKQLASPWSAINVQKYLDLYGNQKQKDAYWKKFKEQARDGKTKAPLFYKNDSADGKNKAGDPIIKGHIAALSEFKKAFPNYLKDFEEGKLTNN